MNIKRVILKWKDMHFFCKCSYLLICILFIMIPFTGLILESFNISIISFNFILGIYVLCIVFSILAKDWKMILIATVGGLMVWAITIGIAEVLWYYLNAWFGIDISYR